MYDVVVAGGTLGVFVAVALAQRGVRVAVLERGKLAGRTQEWNISRKELLELVEVRVVQFDWMLSLLGTLADLGTPLTGWSP
jgi:pyruvate/2-oxoglutarate dehydrogenase complex dihydrolipoamide dehydrogenase (E3) component